MPTAPQGRQKLGHPTLRRFDGAERLHAPANCLQSLEVRTGRRRVGDAQDQVVPGAQAIEELVRDAFAGRVTIMGGIPSVSLLKSSMADDAFERFLDEFFEMIGRGDHLILGISDTTPPAADFERLLKIKKRIEAFGPITF